MVTVPHTGEIRHATFKFPPMFLTETLQANVTDDWVDSPLIAEEFADVWKEHSQNPDHRTVGMTYKLGERSRTQPEIIWEVHGMLAGAQKFEGTDIRATFDAKSGKILDTKVNG